MTPEERRISRNIWNNNWRKANPEKWREIHNISNRKYRENNPNKGREWYHANRECVLKQCKEYRIDNLEKIKEQKAQYYSDKGYKLAYPHRAIWENHFGIRIPEGFVVHHKDKNPLNNTPNNLLCLDRDEHVTLHWILGDMRPVKEE